MGRVSPRVLIPEAPGTVRVEVTPLTWGEAVRLLHYQLHVRSATLMPKVSDYEYLYLLGGGRYRALRELNHQFPICMYRRTKMNSTSSAPGKEVSS